MNARYVTYLDQLGSLVPLAQLLEHVVPLGLEVGLLFDFCLVEAVDDGVFAVGDEDALDLLCFYSQVRYESFYE